MKQIIALDVGVITGMVAHGPKRGEFIDYAQFTLESLESFLRFRAGNGSYLWLVEYPVALSGPVTEVMELVKRRLADEEVVVIRPSEWKSKFSTEPVPDEIQNKAAHIKDAYRMIQYYLAREEAKGAKERINQIY